MKNVPNIFITETNDSVIKFEEKRSVIRFKNSGRLLYKCVKVDGCALKDGIKCDDMLCSADEREERYIELKGQDVKHAIEQICATIVRLGEYDSKRYAYVVCSKVSPQLTTYIQKAKIKFKRQYKSVLEVRSSPVEIKLQ